MPTSGTIAGTISLIVGATLLIVAAVAFIRWLGRSKESTWRSDDREVALFTAIACAFFAIPAITVPLIGFGLVGWNGDYMAYRPVTGQVQQVASRQISDGKTMSTRYVATIGGQPYGIDDTRAALLKAGDTVSLNCVREFVWGSTNNGYACNWG